MIILEGTHNSGKSSLAAKFRGVPVFTAGPAPHNEAEEDQCLAEQMARAAQCCVQDRVTCISQQVYANRLMDSKLATVLADLVKVPHVVVVYCRPPERVLMDLSTHAVKSYDTEEHLNKILDNQHIFIQRYDALMSTIPHVLYDWTDKDVNVNGMINGLIQSQHTEDKWLDLIGSCRIATSF
jgi:hypothetical protein